ncbi:MAG: dihydropteroate synthase [Lachnospiraceae bacterium]|nr:dihydropteroate synthase [Lachnospiraceae bacterium]
MRIGNRDFDENRTHIMGILNVTPDSFSDGGRYNEMDAALFHAEKMIKEGAAIIDVGGESTRPGFAPVSADEEQARILPVIAKIKSEFDIPVSADTYKASTAELAIEAGADLINDVWGLLRDEEMGRVIAKSGVACCLMHNRKEHDYRDFSVDFWEDLRDIQRRAEGFGIAGDKVILDPGVGFQKDTAENLWVIKNLDGMKKLGMPWLLGCSRKSVIGNTLDLPVEERLEGTLVTTVLAVLNGAMFVRVHDVKENLRACLMAEAVKNAKI